MDIADEAARRRAICENNPTSRPLAPRYEETGVSCEDFVRREFGLDPNHFIDAPGGDGGIDFWIKLRTKSGVQWWSIDVKGAHHPNPQWLWVKAGHVTADIYILVSEDEHLGMAMLGWATRREVRAAPISTDANGLTHHDVRRRDLREMSVLRRMHDDV